MRARKIMTLAAAAAVIAPVAGCGSDSEAGDTPDRALRVVGPFEVHSVDPATSNGIFTRMQVAETLVDADVDGALQPGLATSWEATPDQLTWSFSLVDDAVFHDGSPVTADAVVSALETATGKEGTPLADVPVEGVRAEGDAVVIELAEPFAPLPAVLAHTSAQILAPSSYGPDGTVTEVIGTGPYRVSRLQIPQTIEVTAFERWRGTKPQIQQVTYNAVGRSESRALMAESGQADVTFGMDPASLQRVAARDDLAIIAVTLPRTIQLKVNAGHPILGEVRVRRALSMALDREGMATALLRDPEMAATQVFPPSLPDWHQESMPALDHDLAGAEELLAEAGWTRGDDGLLTKDGQQLQLSLRTFPDRPELPPLATAIQARLAEIGIKVDVQIGNSSEIPAGHQDGTLELGLYARNFSLVPDPLVTLLGDFPPEGSDWGAMGWSSEQLDATLAGLAAGMKEPQAEQARAQVAAILQEELPVIPVAWYRQSAVVSDGIEGLVLDPQERNWLLADLSWSKDAR
jgi:peptide/nickel transport system substrate-binding protein